MSEGRKEMFFVFNNTLNTVYLHVIRHQMKDKTDTKRDKEKRRDKEEKSAKEVRYM